MDNIKEEVNNLVKKSKAENIILKLILIIICVVTLIINSTDYKRIFLDNSPVTNYEELKPFIDDNEKFITLDLSNAKETRFSFQNNDKENAAKIYDINYGQNNLLVVVKPNTALTNKVKGELLTDNENIKVIKQKLKEDDNSKNYDIKYFSNMDYTEEEKLIKTKFYVTTILIILLFFGIIIDFVKFINPSKTRLYKKYMKKLNK